MSFYGGEFFGSEYFQVYGHEETYLGTGFFGGDFFGAGFFYESQGQPQEIKTGGKGDNPPRRSIYKPTGLPPYRKTVEQRVAEAREIHREVTREVLKPRPKPIEQMSLAQIESEIGERLRQKMMLEEEEIMLMLLAGAAAG